MGRRKEHERVVQLDAAGTRISWGTQGGEGDRDLPLSSVQDILEGATTTVLESLTTDPARAACCWSIVTDSRTVDFEAQVSESLSWFWTRADYC